MSDEPCGLRPGDRSLCPIANALDLLGDRWTLLVVRDLLFSKKVRFNELVASSERIPTNILAERLKRLEAAGLVEKRAYQRRPIRFEYRLTRRGAELFPVLKELVAWANRHIPGTYRPPPRYAAIGLARMRSRPGSTVRRPGRQSA